MTGCACYDVAGHVWPVSVLNGGIIVVTGPTVVLPLLRQIALAPRPRAVLKCEAIVYDPLGVAFAVGRAFPRRHVPECLKAPVLQSQLMRLP